MMAKSDRCACYYMGDSCMYEYSNPCAPLLCNFIAISLPDTVDIAWFPVPRVGDEVVEPEHAHS